MKWKMKWTTVIYGYERSHNIEICLKAHPCFFYLTVSTTSLGGIFPVRFNFMAAADSVEKSGSVYISDTLLEKIELYFACIAI